MAGPAWGCGRRPLRLLPPTGDSAPEDKAHSRAASEPNFHRRDPPGALAEGERSFHTQEDQQVGVGASVGAWSVPARYSAASVQCPTALPERIEAEPGDEVGSPIGAVAAGAKSNHNPVSNVDAGRNAQSKAGLDRAATGEKPVNPNLALKWLGPVLGG